MRRGRLIALVSGAMASWVAGAVLAQDLSGIDACISRLDPQLDIGYDRIAARCPELAKQLDHGDWVPWLPRGWKETGNDLSAGGLREFRELVAREATTRVSTQIPDVRHLKGVLNGLAGAAPEGWWSRFKSWLRSVLERPPQQTDENWLARLVSRVGVLQSIREIVAYSALGAVIVLALAIVANELRAAGVLGRRRDGVRRAPSSAPAGTGDMTWSDIDSAPLRDKPRLMLELVVRRLSALGYLPAAGALTVRELTRTVRLPEPEDHARLSELALTTERVRFSADPSQPELLNTSVTRGRELLDRLEESAPK